MSKNLLGKDENLNTVQPDFTTGGEALSELLKEGLCPIQTLNVSLKRHEMKRFLALL
jgi:hypothetical protein